MPLGERQWRVPVGSRGQAKPISYIHGSQQADCFHTTPCR